MRTDVTALLVWLLALLLVLPGGSGLAAERPTKVRMDYLYQGYHAPFFVALEKGYYRDAGLAVEFLSGQGSGAGLRSVSSGGEEFGLIDAGVAALGISKGAPVQVVAGYIQQNPTVVISRTSLPVKTPKDMEGKSIAWPPGIAAGFLITAMWRLNGVDESKVRKISTTLQAAEALFLEKKADMMPAFINAVYAGYVAKGLAKDMQILRVSDWGVNALSLAVVANTKLTAEQPAVVRAFVGATMRGLKDVIDNPEAGWKTVVKHRPEVDPALARIGLEYSLALLHTPETKGKPLGWMSEKDWNSTLDFLATYMELAPRLVPSKYYSNDFLP
jgi:NitT/TauT family transport system substrate-binding protein